MAKKFTNFKTRIWLFRRVLANYEYAPEGLVFINEIIDHALQEKENFSKELSRSSLGWIVKDIFGDQVRSVQRGPRGTKQRAYFNLRRVPKNSYDAENRGLLNHTAPGSLSNLVSTLKLPDCWYVIEDGAEQISIIRHERWEFRKQRGTTELKVINKTPQEITLQVKSHGCSVDLKKDCGLEGILNSMPVEKQIVLAVNYRENSYLCFGFRLEEDENVMALLPNINGVLREHDGRECQTVFAENCQVLVDTARACQNCSRLHQVDNNRRKRKAEQPMVHPSCNKRFMTKQDIECQLKSEQRARRNSERREIYWRQKFEQEAVRVADEDQEDLLKMSTKLKENLPEDMRLLWKKQQKIINTKSKNGYRWHPKYVSVIVLK